MKMTSLLTKLGHFRTHQDNKGAFYFTSRAQDKRFIKAIKKTESTYVALPVTVEADGSECVAFHAKTIKSLVEFMEFR